MPNAASSHFSLHIQLGGMQVILLAFTTLCLLLQHYISNLACGLELDTKMQDWAQQHKRQPSHSKT